ncbi:unnamed protein product, partial [Discosporangium mesarthrocarpum]
KGWSQEERQAYLDRISEEDHPLFAENLEETDPDLIKAFQDLTYEGETPESLAEHLKKVGNERFARGKKNAMYYKHAQQAYTEGLKAARSKPVTEAGARGGENQDGAGKTAKTSKTDDNDLSPGLRSLVISLLANRAAANLALKNYGSVRQDCDAALRLDPRHVKCLYRKARAEMLLRRYGEALAVAQQGLAVDPTNSELKKIKDQVPP